MSMRSMTRRATAIAALALAGFAGSAQATLTLTGSATGLGFSLTTFATVAPGNSGCCKGPFGMAVTGNGNVIVSSDATRYVFANTDGQTQGSALFTTPSDSFTAAYAHAGGLAYGWAGGRFVQFKDDGSVDHILTGVTPGPYLGMWGAPNGHVIATSGAGLIDINPLDAGGLGSYRVINASLFGDGVTVSPDGLTAYLEYAGGILPVDITTGATSALISFPSPDGTGIIIGGALNGNLIVNNNNGEVDMYDFSTGITTVLATASDPYGTDRGDYTAIDTKGCLFLAEGDRVDRLCLAGGGIGNPNPHAPEPASLALVGLGLLAAFARRRSR